MVDVGIDSISPQLTYKMPSMMTPFKMQRNLPWSLIVVVVVVVFLQCGMEKNNKRHYILDSLYIGISNFTEVCVNIPVTHY